MRWHFDGQYIFKKVSCLFFLIVVVRGNADEKTYPFVHGAIWTPRSNHWVGVIDDELFLIGGSVLSESGVGAPPHGMTLAGANFRDVWRSKDAISWIRVNDAPWPYRSSPSFVAHNESLWSCGGLSLLIGEKVDPRLNELWTYPSKKHCAYCEEDWFLTTVGPMTERRLPGLVSHEGELFLIGGRSYNEVNGTINHNDVWRLHDMQWIKIADIEEWPNPDTSNLLSLGGIL